MSYEPGTFIDLSHVNKKREVVPSRYKKSFPETRQNLYEVGTQFVFSFTPAGFKAAIKIPVCIA